MHLADLSVWRDEVFSEYKIEMPLWARAYDSDLLPLLTQICASYRIRIYYSAVNRELLPGIEEGDVYDGTRLSASVDPMGENGEFHTFVHFDLLEKSH